MNAGDERLAEIVTGLLHELHPVLVITFGPDGLYGHPDHVATSRATTTAVEAFGPTREAAPALYYQVMSRERVRRMAENGQGPFAGMSEEQLDAFGIPDAEITTVADVTDQVDRKLAAIREHRTQFAPDGPFAGFFTTAGRGFMAQERFRRVDLPWVQPKPDPLLALLGDA
jgi:N-acetyl-1-D-myo-inositol-2-amino-2-deoxy-alpha-D-glucopyranoside deacetylase